jgi:antibiotic biosynthesis monooxygenase (ABM) superfamily enzyme
VASLQRERIKIFSLESNQTMRRWLQSSERTRLAEQIDRCLSEPSRFLMLVSEDRSEPPVVMVFTNRNREERVEDYLAWRRKAIAARALYSGYLATEFFDPWAKV